LTSTVQIVVATLVDKNSPLYPPPQKKNPNSVILLCALRTCPRFLENTYNIIKLMWFIFFSKVYQKTNPLYTYLYTRHNKLAQITVFCRHWTSVSQPGGRTLLGRLKKIYKAGVENKSPNHCTRLINWIFGRGLLWLYLPLSPQAAIIPPVGFWHLY